MLTLRSCADDMTTPRLSCMLSHCCCTVFIVHCSISSLPRSITEALVGALYTAERAVPHVRRTRVAGRPSVRPSVKAAGLMGHLPGPAGGAQLARRPGRGRWKRLSTTTCHIGDRTSKRIDFSTSLPRHHIIFIYSSLFTKNGKKNNTKTIKSERKANNLTKQVKICKHFPIQFIIYSSINQLISTHN